MPRFRRAIFTQRDQIVTHSNDLVVGLKDGLPAHALSGLLLIVVTDRALDLLLQLLADVIN